MDNNIVEITKNQLRAGKGYVFRACYTRELATITCMWQRLKGRQRNEKGL